MRARVKRAASDIAQLAYDESSDDDQVNDQAEQLIFQSRRSTGARTIRPLSQTVVEYFTRLEYLYEHRDEPLGVPTGLYAIGLRLTPRTDSNRPEQTSAGPRRF